MTDTRVKTASGINVVAGLWLIVAPFLLGFGGFDATNAIIIGIVVAVLSLVHSMSEMEHPWIAYVNTILGAWLIVTAFMAMASAVVFWNALVLGIIVGGLSLWSVSSSHPKMHPKM